MLFNFLLISILNHLFLWETSKLCINVKAIKFRPQPLKTEREKNYF